MAFESVTRALRRTLLRLQPGDVVTDGMLLERFVAQRDQAAFEELARRHGPMVFRLCKRVLHHTQDAEDAFQATFVVLARKAASISKQESVGSWLYGVAYRAALQLRERTGRRRAHEQGADNLLAADHRGAAPEAGADLRELGPALDAEVSRLPEKYRQPVVLCYLEGKSTEAAASLLGCGQSALKMRLLRAREMLQQRLTRRGVTLGAASLTTALTQQAALAGASERLLRTTAQGAAHAAEGANAVGISQQAQAVADAVLSTLPARKLRWAVGLVLLLVGVGATATLLLTGRQRTATIPAGMQRVELTSAGKAPFGGAVFSADNRLLALGDRAGGVTVYEIGWGADQLVMKRLPLKFQRPHSSLAFAPTGRRLALGCPDGAVEIRDADTGRLLNSLRAAHNGQVVELAFAPDGQALAALVDKAGLTTWDLRTQGVQGRVDLPEHSRGSNLTYTAHGEVFALHTKLYRVKCWAAVGGEERPLTFPSLPQIVQPGKKPAVKGSTVAIAADSSMAVVADDGNLRLWNRPANRVQHVGNVAVGHPDGMHFLIAPSGDSIACWYRQRNRVQIWDVATKQTIVDLDRPFDNSITCLAYSPDGSKFFWAGFGAPVPEGATTATSAGGILDLTVLRQERSGR